MLADRLRYLFPYSPAGLPADCRQTEGAAKFCQKFLGFDFEDLVRLYEWLWDNSILGGRSSETTFDLIWRRDLLASERRFMGKSVDLNQVLIEFRSRNCMSANSYRAIHVFLCGMLELERMQEFVAAFWRRRRNLRMGPFNKITWLNRAALTAEVSPIVLAVAAAAPAAMPEGRQCCHAHGAAAVLDGLGLRHLPTSGSRYQQYEFAEGETELGFVIIGLLHMRRWDDDNAGPLSREDASELFLFAINFLAWISPDLAFEHLYQRVSKLKEAGLEDVAATISQDTLTKLLESGDHSEPLWNALAEQDHQELGADHVLRMQRMLDSGDMDGRNDPDRNPLIRTSFLPAAWIKDVGAGAMRRAHSIYTDLLRKLDKRYAPGRGKRMNRYSEKAHRHALMMSETAMAPITDFALACNLKSLATEILALKKLV